MRCPECGAENPPEANFCGSCGKALGAALARESGPISLERPAVGNANRLDLPLAQDLADEDAARAASGADASIEPQLGSPSAAVEVARPSGYPPPPDSAARHLPPQPAVMPIAAPPHAVAPPQYAPPPAAQGGQYQPVQRPVPIPPGYGAPYAYQDISHGNTSGLGPGYPHPPQATGWSFAGFVPYGIFSFVHNSILWGILGIIFPIVSVIFVGIQGRQTAWENRRFNSIEEYEGTMKVWSTAGMWCLIVGGVLMILYFVFVFAITFFAMSEGMKTP